MQGVRQAALGNTSGFKESIDDYIENIKLLDIVFHIGQAYVGALACADDVGLIVTF